MSEQNENKKNGFTAKIRKPQELPGKDREPIILRPVRRPETVPQSDNAICRRGFVLRRFLRDKAERTGHACMNLYVRPTYIERLRREMCASR